MSEIGQKLIAQIREIAAANPDYVYERPPSADPDSPGSCRYVYNGQPSCIVGHAAWNLKLIDATFEQNRDNTADVTGLVDALSLEVDDEERYWIDYAQSYQDNGSTWGNVPGQADADMRRLLYEDESY